LPFPPLGVRFEQLEETPRIAQAMWAGPAQPFEGSHFRLAEPLNQPPAISRPHPPVLIGGGGEKEALRLVAQYADACTCSPSAGPKRSGTSLTSSSATARRSAGRMMLSSAPPWAQ
jgi:alkanesulfonate monooxygenase SsuD/methylene tetrahydromethanopterin reductase-like flavin-dependent oxidoreductase (luciferase family)